MKTDYLSILKWTFFVVALCLSNWLTWKVAERQTTHKALYFELATFFNTLEALQDLQSGNVSNAVAVIELRCFSSARILLDDPELMAQPATFEAMKDLAEYRKRYGTNNLDWLDNRLKKSIPEAEANTPSEP